MHYDFNNQIILTDDEGFLKNQEDWSIDLANYIAHINNVELTEQHWLIVNFVRNYFNEFNTTPAIRLLVKNLAKEFGAEIGNSRNLQRMFNDSPAKTIAKIAGLPKPAKCL